jgi:hypothetical protein
MMNRSYGAALLFVVGLMLVPSWCGSVQLSMRDTSFIASDTLRISLFVDSIPTTPGLLSYQLILSYDPQVLVGVGASAQGTLTEALGDPFSSNGTLSGELRIATAGTHSVSGTGALVTFLLRAAVSAGVSSDLRLDSILLNEGFPAATYRDPLAHIAVLGSTNVPRLRNESTIDAVTVAPNPVRDFLSLSFPASSRVGYVRIWNLLGQEVISVPLNNNRLRISVSNLTNGMYILTADGLPRWSSHFVVIE